MDEHDAHDVCYLVSEDLVIREVSYIYSKMLTSRRTVRYSSWRAEDFIVSHRHQMLRNEVFTLVAEGYHRHCGKFPSMLILNKLHDFMFSSALIS